MEKNIISIDVITAAGEDNIRTYGINLIMEENPQLSIHEESKNEGHEGHIEDNIRAYGLDLILRQNNEFDMYGVCADIESEDYIGSGICAYGLYLI